MNKNILFESIKLGGLNLKNRIMMASLTRCRADKSNLIPNDLHVKYYAQRANAGLILSEASPVSLRGLGFPGAASIFNDPQMEGWKRVNDAVHEKDGKIGIQLYHSGRATISSVQNGLKPWSASAIAIRMKFFLTDVDQEVPHAMTKDEIKVVIEEFVQAARRSQKAGFDSVQLHAAHGYLFDQFLRDGSNQRTDEYGGSVENRCRLTLETIDALCQEFGASKVGIKLSPNSSYNDMRDSDPVKTFTYLLKELSKRNLSFVELKDDNEPENQYEYGHLSSKAIIPDVYGTFRKVYAGNIIANGFQTFESATKGVNDNLFDGASFGRPYITSKQQTSHTLLDPDLVQRFQNNWSLNTDYQFEYFFCEGEKGYSDYPPYQKQ